MQTLSPTVRKLSQQFAQSTETVVLVGGFFVLVLFLAVTLFETIHEKNFPSLLLKPHNGNSVLGAVQQATPSATPTIEVTTIPQKTGTISGTVKLKTTLTPTITLRITPAFSIFTKIPTQATTPIPKSKTGTIQAETLSAFNTATVSKDNTRLLSPLIPQTINTSISFLQQNFGL